jgi:hypothetical protein
MRWCLRSVLRGCIPTSKVFDVDCLASWRRRLPWHHRRVSRLLWLRKSSWRCIDVSSYRLLSKKIITSHVCSPISKASVLSGTIPRRHLTSLLECKNITPVPGLFHSSVPSQLNLPQRKKMNRVRTASSVASARPSSRLIASGSISLTNPSLPEPFLSACMTLCLVNFQ